MTHLRDNSALNFTAAVVIGAVVVVVGLVIVSVISVAIHVTLVWLYSAHVLTFAAGYLVCLLWHDKLRNALAR